ncbi:hypothetical protein Q3V30_20775 [Erwinia pyri]|uniref:Uncharacterized protein n=1 Tax=Erwinia pyri TaxID=3062598 RepID=A0AA50DIS1_9GAMM|nr:hypothetical protein [Erwinia sp. DE2]WLS78824.1 hypothetical protein Q3V30_20775 [Erwinia sp. DE2]
MRIIAGGLGTVNPYAAIARPYLEKFHQQVDEARGGSKMALAFKGLSTEERRVIFILGNGVAIRSPREMEKLTERHILLSYEELSNKEKLTVIRGMKEAKKLAAKIPYSPPGEEEALKNPRTVTPETLDDYQNGDSAIPKSEVNNVSGF